MAILRFGVMLPKHNMYSKFKGAISCQLRLYQTMHKDCYEKEAEEVFHSAVASVLPKAMLDSALKLEGDTLNVVGGRQYQLNGNLRIVAVGKAVAGMVRVAEDITCAHLKDGVASVPKGMKQSLIKKNRPDLWPSENSVVEVREGSPGNIPDNVAMETASNISDFAGKLGSEDVLLTLISGGGSSLLPMPRSPVTIEDLSTLTRLMSRHGATIQDMNVVRSRVEVLKGGGLARQAHPAKVISLILSDVIGDPLESIASGPTYVQGSSPSNQQCEQVFQRLGIEADVPTSVRTLLQDKTFSAENPSDLDVNNQIIGSNRIALKKAEDKAKEMGLQVCTLSHSVEGDVSEVCKAYTSIIEFAVKKGGATPLQVTPTLDQQAAQKLRLAIDKAKENKAKLCVLAAGEPTVVVKGKGKGGRNQHLALQISVETRDLLERNWTFLAAGTDGQDGPTPAAGAFSYPLTSELEVNEAQRVLDNNDAFTHYTQEQQGRYLVTTGLTGTNVMDIHVFLFDYSQ